MGIRSAFSDWKFSRSVAKADASSWRQATNALLETLGMSRPMANQIPTSRIFIFPQYNYHPETIYAVARYSDILRIVHNALKGEIFRNGFEISPAEDTDEEVVVAEDVQANNMVGKAVVKDETATQDKTAKPNPKERKEILEFLERCNENRQSILDVCKQLEDDINIMDDGYMLLLRDYVGKNDVEGKLKEIIRVDPKYMALVMNEQDIPGVDSSGLYIMSTPLNRTTYHLVKPEDADRARDPETGGKLLRVFYKHKSADSKDVYYFEHEIVHVNRYFPSTCLGFSPVITLWEKVQTLMAMDIYMQQLYSGQRPPKGMMIMKTANREGLAKAWDEMLARVVKNPHLPGMMGIQASAGNDSSRFAEFFDFMKSLDEMQYTEARNEMRSQIGAFYGVSPVFQNDVSTSGGLNNEGLQITVTNRASERCQQDYNDKFFRAVMKAMKKAHWVLRLRPSEEQDEMAKIERVKLMLENGKSASAAGLEAEWDANKGEVIIKSGKFAPPQSPFGSPGSMGASGAPPNTLPGASSGENSAGESDASHGASGSPADPSSPEDVLKGGSFFR